VSDAEKKPNPIAALLLPSLAIACVYLTIVRPKSADRLAKARQELIDVRARIPAEGVLQAAIDTADQVRGEIQIARAARLTATAPEPETASPVSHDSVAAWLRRLSAIFDRHGVAILKDDALEVDVPQELREAKATLQQKVPARRMELAGSYGSMVRALHDIRQTEPDRIVLDLELRSNPSAGTLRWRVTIR